MIQIKVGVEKGRVVSHRLFDSPAHFYTPEEARRYADALIKASEFIERNEPIYQGTIVLVGEV